MCRRADWLGSHWATHSMVSAQHRAQTGHPCCRREKVRLATPAILYTGLQKVRRCGRLQLFFLVLWDQAHGTYRTQKPLRKSQALPNSENLITKIREMVSSLVTKRESIIWQDSPKLLQTKWSLLWPQRGRRQRPSKRAPANQKWLCILQISEKTTLQGS